jgi:hypothetical protein
VESALSDHLHKADYNVCIVCLLQPGAIPVPAPFSWSSVDQAVDPQREVEATPKRVTFSGRLNLRLRRWIPPMQNDSELEETVTPSWMFQSDADFQQMVEGADLQQAVTRSTEPVTLTELYLKWIVPKREDSGINETATPNAFPEGSPSRVVGPNRAVGAAAEPITPTEGHPRSIPSQQTPAPAPSGAFPSVCLDIA